MKAHRKCCKINQHLLTVDQLFEIIANCSGSYVMEVKKKRPKNVVLSHLSICSKV